MNGVWSTLESCLNFSENWSAAAFIYSIDWGNKLYLDEETWSAIGRNFRMNQTISEYARSLELQMNELREDLIYCSVKRWGWFFSTSCTYLSFHILVCTSPHLSSPRSLTMLTFASIHRFNWTIWLLLRSKHESDWSQVMFYAVITIEHKNYCTEYQNGPSVGHPHEPLGRPQRPSVTHYELQSTNPNIPFWIQLLF